PDGYQWYKDQQPITGATNSTLTVEEPGEYALHLFDEHGCEDATVSSIFINQIRSPHLSAEITGSICDGDDIELTGTLVPGSTEYRISRKKNNGNYTVVQAWTTGPGIDYTDSAPGVGD